MKKILICGAFAFSNMATGGQPVKTRELFYGLQKMLGEDQVDFIESVGWQKHPFRLLRSFFMKARNAKNIIMLPAQKGVNIFSRLLIMSRTINRNKIFYDVVGGWLPEKIEKDKKLRKVLSKFDGIWVETSIMKDRLSALGLTNVTLVRNFKNLKPVSIDEFQSSQDKSFHLCMFSRVVKEKGIEDAILAVKEIREKYSKMVYLDIYGAIDDDYKDRFKVIRSDLPEYIKYKGVVPPSDSVKTLKTYDAMLFPTRYETEGLPGTIIDAYFAGVPVISAKWESYLDIVEEGKTGIGYTQKNYSALVDALLWACNNTEIIHKMREKCIEKAQEFSRPIVLQNILGNLGLDCHTISKDSKAIES